jgi:phosphoribosylamine--glycine ligase
VPSADYDNVVLPLHCYHCIAVKILIIGGGGREHAIAWKIVQSTLCDKVYACPGNPGIAAIAGCVPLPSPEPQGYLELAEQYDIDLTVVGPEAPLVAGVVDAFRTRRRKIIGPALAAARLEGSKLFAKRFMQRAGIPTARFEAFNNPEEARKSFNQFGFPVVLKADGLAAGKGVVIAEDERDALGALERLPAGKVVVEECLQGEEVSFIALCDGEKAIPFEATQDHKAIHDGDRGPNTGGMGAYCDARILTAAQKQGIMASVVYPTLALMCEEGNPFTGFLYAGLMMTAEGPKVLEYNVRLGDPEAQPLMHAMASDFLATLAGGAPIEWRPDPSVCVVLSAAGYPGTPRTGDVITGIESCGATVFQAGTKIEGQSLVTAGGRVLGVTSSGSDLQTAIANTYRAVERIHFEGMHYRTDIGQKGLKRW